jgi:hypothetical protein
MADDDPARGQHFLDHPQAQREPKIQPNRIADHLGREAMLFERKLAGAAPKSAQCCRYRSRSAANGALLCRSKAAESVKIFSNMTNLQDDGSSARAQIYVASITGFSCTTAAQKPQRT